MTGKAAEEKKPGNREYGGVREKTIWSKCN